MSEQKISRPDVEKWKQELEQVSDRLWSTWETGELESLELDGMSTRFRQWYADTGEAECLWLLSEIEIYRSRVSRDAAGGLAHEGLERAPESTSLHDNRVFGLGGVWPDFHKTNYHRLIAEYETRVTRNPNLFIARRILIEHLLADYRLEEAELQIEQARSYAGEQAYVLDFYQGEILYVTGKRDEGVWLWKNTCERYSEHGVCFYMLGSQYAKFARYEEASGAFERSFAQQVKPRKIDSLQALLDVYEILSDRPALLHTLDRILEIYAEDYGINEGSEIEVYLRRREEVQ